MEILSDRSKSDVNGTIDKSDLFIAVKELDEYIITQDRTWSAPEYMIGPTNVFDQIFSGDYFNEKFDNHINQLDSLQREVINRIS